MKKHIVIWMFVYWLCFLLYSIFSYALTDPNLVLSGWAPYWQFQTWMWQTLFDDRRLTVWLYVVIVLALFAVYWKLIRLLRAVETQFSWRHIVFGLLVLSPLILSYNALSHDVFNYIFNARMVVEYQLDPHQVTALSAPSDDWKRFMHNTHTTAPYGYSWTALSLVPYVLGFELFSLTWISFRLFMIISLIGAVYAVQFVSRLISGRNRNVAELALLFLNPLVAIEVVSNMHNDFWMLLPALFSLGLFWQATSSKKIQIWKLVSAIALLIFSIFIKYTTLVWMPVIILMIIQARVMVAILDRPTAKIPTQFLRDRARQAAHQIMVWIQQKLVWQPTVLALLSFLPLLTQRSQHFHPWYLIWSLLWIPYLRSSLLGKVLLIFSLSSLLRYAVWIATGEFTDQVLMYQKITTWVVPLVYLLWGISQSLHTLRTSHWWQVLVGSKRRLTPIETSE